MHSTTVHHRHHEGVSQKKKTVGGGEGKIKLKNERWWFEIHIMKM